MKLQSAKGLTEDEKQEVLDTVQHTNVALMLISKGTVFIESQKDAFKLSGDKVGADLIMASNKDPKKVSKMLSYFEWEYERDGDSLTGEGVIAYTMFQILMGGTNNLEMMKDFFSKLSLALRNL